MDVLSASLAFLVGGLLVGLELITGSYPRTWFCIWRSTAFWAYCIIYGLIAAAVFLGLDSLIAAGKLQLGEGLSSAPWAQAVIIGISTRSLLHINLFNVTISAQQFPVGLATLTQFFEPHLLRTVLFDEFNAVRDFVAPAASRYPKLDEVIKRITDNTPRNLPPAEVAAFRDEVSRAADSTEAMEKALRFLGKRAFNRIFP